MAKGLIPLMLSPNSTASFGSRSSSRTSGRASVSPPVSPAVQPGAAAAVTTTAPTTTTAPAAHRRYASDVTPVIRLSRPPVRTSMRRQSQQAPAPRPLSTISTTTRRAYSPAEWKKAIAEVKRHHVTRRFRACLARCNEILSSLPDPSTVEPAYLIYLHFYAAMSLELCARPLTAATSSAYRTSLLQQARDHYTRAADLLRTAEDTAISQSRSSSVASSLPSLLHSPSTSVSSSSWAPSCSDGHRTPPPPSPFSPRYCKSLSLDSAAAAARITTATTNSKPSITTTNNNKKKTKKVSFELPKDKTQWAFTLPEPFIRPDSPTLGGVDDEYFAAGAMRQELPELPLPPPPPTAVHSLHSHKRSASPPPPIAMPVISEEEAVQQEQTPPLLPPRFRPCSSPLPPLRSPTTNTMYNAYDDDHDHESARALGRYCETLATLSRQVARHTASLDALLAANFEQQQREEEADLVVVLHDPRRQYHRKGTSSTSSSSSFLSSSVRSNSSLSFASGYGDGDNDDGGGEENRQQRMDRLRMSGWKRKRFDGARYAQLCEAVMAELSQA